MPHRLAFLLVVMLVALGASLAGELSAQTGEQRESRLHEAERMAVSAFQDGIARVRPLLERYGYPAVFVAVGAEGMLIPAPGQTLLIAAAIDAVHGGLNIVILVAVALLA